MANPSWLIPASTQQKQTTTSSGFDPKKQGKYEGAFDYLSGGISTGIENQGQWVGGEGGSYQDNFVDTRDHGALSGMVKVGSRDYGNESAIGSGPKYELDYEKLPNKGMTKAGRIDQVYRVEGLNDVINPNLVIWDDNYGYITDKRNRKPRLGDMVGPMVASLAMGGLMGAALPAGIAASGVKAAMSVAPSVSRGKFDPVSLGMTALGVAAPSMGMPSWVIPAAKSGYSLSQIYSKG